MTDDAVTRLVVQGADEFISKLTAAANAQDKFTQTIRSAAGIPVTDLDTNISNVAVTITKAARASTEFRKELKEALKESGLPNNSSAITAFIKSQVAAYKELAATIEETAKKEAEFNARRASNRAANLADVPRGRQTGLVNTGGTFAPVTQNFGNRRSDSVIEQNILKQQNDFLNQQVAVREAIDERRTKAEQLRTQQRIRNAEEEAKAKRAALLKEINDELEFTTRINQFKKDNPAVPTSIARKIVGGGDTGQGVTAQEQEKIAEALRHVDDSQKKVGASGVSYLSTLSALHSAQFIATGQTFGLAQSLGTLVLAFSKIGTEAGGFNVKMAGLGAGLGVGLLAIRSALDLVSDGIHIVLNVVGAGIDLFTRFGSVAAAGLGAAAVAAVKLASTTEDAFSEIAAFGEPTKAQLGLLDDQISNLARTFGRSASDIASGASVFIRAGGSVKEALEGGTEAVLKLQIASRGELVPEQAARAIVTVTNAFKEFKITASDAVNIMVGAAQKTALTFSEITQAFQQAAPTAALLKIPLVDLATTIGVLANEGLRGQVAGTGLKQFLLDLLHPSEQAKAKLQEFGISIEDSSHRIRPLRDILIDMQHAFGEEAQAADKSGDATKAQGLAAIFGSRANLAAAIIARTGAKAFDELKSSIENVDANNVVEVLLSTTSSQASIAKTNIEELARAFGGPLNVGIGTALKSVNEFLRGIDRNVFEQAGQAVLAIVTGSGFGKLKETLDSIPNDRVREFFTGIIDSALTVRNAIVNDLIPAFQTAGSNIASALGDVNITETFTNATAAITGFIHTGGRLVVFISEMVASFIKGDEKGQAIRQQLENIATTIRTVVIAAFELMVIHAGLAIAAVTLLGGGMRKLLEIMSATSDATNKARIQELGNNVNQTAGNVSNLSANLEDANRQLGELDAKRQALIRAGNLPEDQRPTGLNLAVELGQLDKERNALVDRQRDLRDNLSAEKRLNDLANTTFKKESSQANPFREALNLLNQTQDFSLDSFLNQLQGDIPNALTNVARQLRDIEDTGNRGAPERGEGTSPAFFPDPKKEEKVREEVVRILRQADDERQNILEDSATKEEQAQRTLYNKLIDLGSNYYREIAKIDEDAQNRIDKNDETFTFQREQGHKLEAFQRTLDKISYLRDQDNAKRDLQIQQADAAEDKSNQRRVQDADRALSKIEDREQRSEDIRNQIADRTFQRQQQSEDTAFSRNQNKEATGFERQLDDRATARQNALKSATITDPKERIAFQKDIENQRRETLFQRSQDDLRTQFRIKQEDTRIKFTQGQEDKAFQRQISQEEKLFNFKVGLELKYLQLRRGLEDDETVRQNGVEYSRLLRRLGFSDKDYQFRLDQADKLKAFQEDQQDTEHARTNQEIRNEANTRKVQLGEKLSDDIFAVFDDADRARQTNQEQRIARLRNVQQTASRALAGITEKEGPTAIVEQAFGRLNVDFANAALLLGVADSEAKDFLTTLKDITTTGFGVPGTAPDRQMRFTLPQTRNDVDAAISFQAVRQAIGAISQSFFAAAIQQAAANQQPSQPEQNFNLTVAGNLLGDQQWIQQLQQLVFRNR